MYLGLRFHKAELLVPVSVTIGNSIIISSCPKWMTSAMYTSIICAIEADYLLLNYCFPPKKKKKQQQKWVVDGTFTRIDETECFVYHHTVHTASSAALYSNFYHSSVFETTKEEKIIQPCKATDHDHHLLSNFFRSNPQLKAYLQFELEQKRMFLEELKVGTLRTHMVNQTEKLKEYLEELESFVNLPDQNSMLFAYNVDHMEGGLLCNEDVWTKRLVGGLERILPTCVFVHGEVDVMFSADTKEFNKSLSKYSRLDAVSASSHTGISVFHGTPDIIIKDKPLTVNVSADADMVSDEDDDQDVDSVNNSSAKSDYLVNEQCHQMNVLFHDLPEKSGELLANMFWLAKCKILKRYKLGKPLKETKIKGMLLDRQHGAVILALQFHISSFEEQNYHQLHILNQMSGTMDTDILCGHIQELFQC